MHIFCGENEKCLQHDFYGLSDRQDFNCEIIRLCELVVKKTSVGKYFEIG
jgi:hypothetical protein